MTNDKALKFIKRDKIGERTFLVDGISNDTIYEFYGDFWHGNPKKYDEYEINKVNKKTFGELYRMALYKEKYIKNKGYQIITIWESDYDSKF